MMLDTLADEAGLPRVRLRDVVGAHDAQAARLLRVVQAEIERPGAASPMLIDQVTHALGLHLLRRYGVDPAPASRRRHAPLTDAEVAEARAYLAERLADHVRLAEIAAAVGYSPTHFAKRFKAATSLTPDGEHQRLRVARAADLLRTDPHRTIAAIAQQVGYADQSHLGKHFAKHHTATPAAYRRRATT